MPWYWAQNLPFPKNSNWSTIILPHEVNWSPLNFVSCPVITWVRNFIWNCFWYFWWSSKNICRNRPSYIWWYYLNINLFLFCYIPLLIVTAKPVEKKCCTRAKFVWSFDSSNKSTIFKFLFWNHFTWYPTVDLLLRLDFVIWRHLKRHLYNESNSDQ